MTDKDRCLQFTDTEYQEFLRDLFSVREGLLNDYRVIDSDKSMIPLSASQFDMLDKLVESLCDEFAQLHEWVRTLPVDEASGNSQAFRNLFDSVSRVSVQLKHPYRTLSNVHNEDTTLLEQAQQVQDRIDNMRKIRSAGRTQARTVEDVRQAVRSGKLTASEKEEIRKLLQEQMDA